MQISEVHTYLINSGLLERETIISGQYSVTENNTRNQIFKVYRGMKSAYFIKQISPENNHEAGILSKEANCLRLFQHIDEYKCALPYVTNFVTYDKNLNILVSECIKDSENLDVVYESFLPKNKKVILKMIAKILASFHFPLSESLKAHQNIRFFPRQIPWTFNLLDWERGLSPPPFDSKRMKSQVIAALQQHTVHLNLVANAKSDYKFVSLIHGDIKFNNFLIANKGDDFSIKIIDWEISDIGDPSWDLAGLMQNLLLKKILEFESEKSQNGYITSVDLNLFLNEWEEIELFWQHYRTYSHNQFDLSISDLKKSLQFTAVRLIQSAFEFNTHLSHLRPAVKGSLQLSLLMLQNIDVLMDKFFVKSHRI